MAIACKIQWKLTQLMAITCKNTMEVIPITIACKNTMEIIPMAIACKNTMEINLKAMV